MKKFIFLTLFFYSCASSSYKEKIMNDEEFKKNVYTILITCDSGKRQKSATLFRSVKGVDAVINDSLKNYSDIDKALNYILLISPNYKGDVVARLYINISLLYYYKGDRKMSDKYYRIVEREMIFSDETIRVFRKIMKIYPDY
ncbi:MAG TPA: hypothetical protein PK385_08195 [Spirochaetota bacterium]|jgi:hypothetical protein|nr:MAG: hypothetical protein BWX91_01585 [Spirochaetes bacterium ADurb.Bin133]HNZ26918.1 hypothetical protein [Spirochaetota bacterium]HOF00736.1 hypothetical protein [Spirochaetota bacterium]HOS32507.1 hypothetical protein [Spirochaetota bacterium]HOS56025.1 hypothetical protein [Spirochaetota bacterium]